MMTSTRKNIKVGSVTGNCKLNSENCILLNGLRIDFVNNYPTDYYTPELYSPQYQRILPEIKTNTSLAAVKGLCIECKLYFLFLGATILFQSFDKNEISTDHLWFPASNILPVLDVYAQNNRSLNKSDIFINHIPHFSDTDLIVPGISQHLRYPTGTELGGKRCNALRKCACASFAFSILLPSALLITIPSAISIIPPLNSL